MIGPIGRRRLLGGMAGLVLVGVAPGWAPGWAETLPDTSKPQPELPREKLVIVGHDGTRHDFMVEMALTPAQQEVGEMWRPTVPPDGGMLFDWGAARDSYMWMKNTLAALDMVFINADATIRSIAENTVPRSLATISSHGPVRATLELAAGTTKRLDIRVGDKVECKVFGNLSG